MGRDLRSGRSILVWPLLGLSLSGSLSPKLNIRRGVRWGDGGISSTGERIAERERVDLTVSLRPRVGGI